MKFFLNKDKNVMEIVLYDLHNLPLPAPSFLALIKQEILFQIHFNPRKTDIIKQQPYNSINVDKYMYRCNA